MTTVSFEVAGAVYSIDEEAAVWLAETLRSNPPDLDDWSLPVADAIELRLVGERHDPVPVTPQTGWPIYRKLDLGLAGTWRPPNVLAFHRGVQALLREDGQVG